MSPHHPSYFPAQPADIPDLVRAAYDAIPDGIVVLDQLGRIRFANHAFHSLKPELTDDPTGGPLSAQTWLTPEAESEPWINVIATNTLAIDRPFSIQVPNQVTRQFSLNAAPINDDSGEAIGCIVILHKVSRTYFEVERLHSELEELKSARSKVELKYQELLRFATRDSLTGCYNRRAFFSVAEPLFHKLSQENRPLCCIMADIDHFKLVNDSYGHSVGDQAILSVARSMTACLRVNDLLCRYGGEEFCILLPDTKSEQAMEIAKRLRQEVEQNAGASVRSIAGIQLTSSFGVASSTPELAKLNELIELSDYALYVSKRNGRNRVTLWAENLSTESADPKSISTDPLTNGPQGTQSGRHG